MISRSASGCQTSMTASQTSKVYSRSVSTKISGEYSKPKIVSSVRTFSARAITWRVPSTARSRISSLPMRKTTSRNRGDKAL